MADSPRADDGKGAPPKSPDTTTETPKRDLRLFPGGRVDAPPVGVNAISRKDLPSGGVSPNLDFQDSPDDGTAS